MLFAKGVAARFRPAKHGPSDFRQNKIFATPRLIALWPHELADQSPDGSLLILSKLRRALRAERRRALAGHWSYELNRHLGLMMAYKAELGLMRRAKLRPSRTAPAAARSTSAAAAPESGEGGVRPAREQPR